MFVQLMPDTFVNHPNERLRVWMINRYPLKARSSFDDLKSNLYKLSYKTAVKYYTLPLCESGENSLNRLGKNPSISEMVKTIQKEWNLKQFKEIEVIGDKVKILNHYFDLESFYKQYKRLIDCLYCFDYYYIQSAEEYEKADCPDGIDEEQLIFSVLSVCPLDGDY